MGAGVLDRYQPVIGLEVHCQLKTESKLFCSCSTEFGRLPNHNSCPVCLGHPGVLPTLNKKAVDLALKLALALEGKVQQHSLFARKQYFYPDLPKGYQISQFNQPYCLGGCLKLSDGHVVELERIHIEEDAGKNVHSGRHTFVDLNRAGVPLVEIVTRPALFTAEQAADYLRRLRSLVRHLDVSDGNMEEGSLRCDANVSIRPTGTEALGTRCEIKNLNSFRNVEKAIRYEILRQADVIDHGQRVVQETRSYDPASGKTATLRSKEESHDYRYFPEPDLGVLVITEDRITEMENSLPELPETIARRYQRDYGLSPDDARLLTSDRDITAFFEQVRQQCATDHPELAPKFIGNWLITEFLREAAERDWNLSAAPISPTQIAGLMGLIASGTISGKIAKKVLAKMVAEPQDPVALVAKKGWQQISDLGQIERVVIDVLDSNSDQLSQFLAGKEKIYDYFVGQVMRQSGGKLNPELVNDTLRSQLEKRRNND